MNARIGLRRPLPALVMGLCTLAVVLPLLWVVRVALKPTDDYIGDPGSFGGGWTLENFGHAWSNGGIGDALFNSLRIVPLGAVLATVLATLAGYGLSKMLFPGRRFVFGIAVATMTLPLAALVIPLFDEGLRLGYVDSRFGLSLIYATLFAPWGTLFLASYFRGLPDELLESAQVDGAGTLRAFWSIAVPLALPAIATVLILNVFLQWSELILALVMLPDSSKQTITVAIAQFSGQFRTGGPLTAAGMIMAAAPVMVVFLLGQRWLRAGVTAGAVKG
ncbi:carbohydrate ABC transporter permease [Conexibacter sp. JD483]|uniref:carbohydrate ABC transporter permease n=1 Tax=unclassified Conexibacter TaxID=2627773 RepID=UPI00271D279A|nr:MULTISPECIES: carbohydrate ABC transporter permease [unclassified Conexibacter]MDO8188011.1 carbohydrate ABC transporter permease [Conexibacter sp. CPCC 205706]MDO8200894.1 carbohydrate ABC transporter permease [Conexibacter sp. CPCC 205762]MDR9370373.1 carbohydrate ABC transporter permease [Conexibacter sp. JD483]